MVAVMIASKARVPLCIFIALFVSRNILSPHPKLGRHSESLTDRRSGGVIFENYIYLLTCDSAFYSEVMVYVKVRLCLEKVVFFCLSLLSFF